MANGTMGALKGKKLITFFWVICESMDIQFGGRSIFNHSGRKTAIQQEDINRFFRALMVVNNGEGSYKENEALGARTVRRT
ncbi:hypothetical protein C2G38_2183297 [Gigaspora rosea]|uniref:Uncharacterized protein n=1 Tax=Gigaspora rosea TaxID=44941 RepID=A0A397V8Q4_9GLOM|nr:hypothetical protein C2G38_2183297 [Gigaspora rosea]